LPVINIGPDTTYCGSFSRTLTSDSINSLWSTGSNSQQIVVTTPGIYWAETSNACGTTRDSIIVQQNTVPTVWLGNDTPICNGQTIILQPVSSGGSYVWSDGSTGATLNINTAGLYWVEVTLNGCNNRDTIQVSAGTLPVVNLGPDTIVCDNEYTLLLNIPGATYLWENNSTDSFYNISQSGTYTVTVTNTCGSSTGEITVELHADECAVLIPTAFSPNEDGANDLFRGICRCPAENYELEIYNRWGELVFKADDIRDGWNGNYQNLQQPLGVYVYQLSYYSYCAQKKVYRKGNVTLVR
ncbi:MAG TPA: gliding motility-associated C-terminal domain-containing protein, partial [Chitinophagales bacterium]|nr:gliding motility-associated C-terminal domain-containing protein [Chitinophagales bacterium]